MLSNKFVKLARKTPGSGTQTTGGYPRVKLHIKNPSPFEKIEPKSKYYLPSTIIVYQELKIELPRKNFRDWTEKRIIFLQQI